MRLQSKAKHKERTDVHNMGLGYLAVLEMTVTLLNGIEANNLQAFLHVSDSSLHCCDSYQTALKIASSSTLKDAVRAEQGQLRTPCYEYLAFRILNDQCEQFFMFCRGRS